MNPARSAVSATISEIPLAPPFGSVLATTTIRSASDPLEMKVLAPLMTYSSPSRSAVVLMLFRSEPAPGSVIAIAVIISPLASFGSQRRRCSSVP